MRLPKENARLLSEECLRFTYEKGKNQFQYFHRFHSTKRLCNIKERCAAPRIR